MDEGIPIPVQSLLTERIGSVAQLEALLLLHALAVPGSESPAGRPVAELGARDAASVAGALRIGTASAALILDELARGLLVVVHPDAANPASPPLYRFPVENPALRAAVDQLRATYAERRVSVIALIFSKPSAPGASSMRSFSEAFRLRPDTEGPHG